MASRPTQSIEKNGKQKWTESVLLEHQLSCLGIVWRLPGARNGDFLLNKHQLAVSLSQQLDTRIEPMRYPFENSLGLKGGLATNCHGSFLGVRSIFPHFWASGHLFRINFGCPVVILDQFWAVQFRCPF